MSVIKWRESYNTGIEQFDGEHHKIVELIDILFTVLRDQNSKEAVSKVCDDLLVYTKHHFSNEEEAMKSVDYPDLEEHIAEHERLKNEVQEFQAMIEAEFPKGTPELYRFLREWLVKHIQEIDKKYTPYLKS